MNLNIEQQVIEEVIKNTDKTKEEKIAWTNACYTAYQSASTDAKKMLAEPVPLIIRNAPTTVMKNLIMEKVINMHMIQ